MSDEQRDSPTTQTETDESIQPVGAIVVTGILLVTILLFWFGTYLVNYLRGG